MSGACETDNSPNWMTQPRARRAVRRAENPATKAGQIRAFWPDADAALGVGQSTKRSYKRPEEDAGITLGITDLTSYISHIRRRQRANRDAEAPTGQSVRSQTESIPAIPAERVSLMTPVPRDPAPKPPDDALAQAMRALSKPKMDIRKIHNNGDPEGRNLI
jgi:hypothetical protein